MNSAHSVLKNQLGGRLQLLLVHSSEFVSSQRLLRHWSILAWALLGMWKEEVYPDGYDGGSFTIFFALVKIFFSSTKIETTAAMPFFEPQAQ
ncbi:hypothetical protein FF1_031085 [Malus domestica]